MPALYGSPEVKRDLNQDGLFLQAKLESGRASNRTKKALRIQQQHQGDLSTKQYTGGLNSMELQMSLAPGPSSYATLESRSHSKGKLFTREFYNLQRSNKKRDIESVSLHKHPKSHLHGIFDKWRVMNSIEDSGAKPHQHATLSPRNLLAQQHNVHKSVDHGQGTIPLRHLAKYGMGTADDHHQKTSSLGTTSLPYINTVDSVAPGGDPYQHTSELGNLDQEVNVSNLNLTIQHPPHHPQSTSTRRSKQPSKDG